MSVMSVTTLVLTSVRTLVISSSAVVTVMARAAAVGWSWSRWPSSLGSSTSFVSGVCYLQSVDLLPEVVYLVLSREC